jgi:hypothetical protein
MMAVKGLMIASVPRIRPELESVILSLGARRQDSKAKRDERMKELEMEQKGQRSSKKMVGFGLVDKSHGVEIDEEELNSLDALLDDYFQSQGDHQRDSAEPSSVNVKEGDDEKRQAL